MSNWHGGKGSKRRNSNEEAYRENYDKTYSEARRQQSSRWMTTYNKAKPPETNEQKAIRGKAISNGKSQHWVLTELKSGAQIPVRNLNKWCRENGCDHSNFHAVVKGKVKQHKGMTCRKVTKEEYDALLAA